MEPWQIAIDDDQNACAWMQTRVPRNPLVQHLIMLLTRAESRDSSDYFSAYVNTHRNQLPDAGARVLNEECGADAEAQAEINFEWARRTLPGYEVENWTKVTGELLGRACYFGSLELIKETREPTAVASQLRAGASQLVTPSCRGDVIFEHCDGTRSLTQAFVEAGYVSMRGSKSTATLQVSGRHIRRQQCNPGGSLQ